MGKFLKRIKFSFSFQSSTYLYAWTTVQVIVKTANKSLNTHHVFANFRYDKETQVNEHHGLSREEKVKIEQDGEANGWIKYGSTEPRYG